MTLVSTAIVVDFHFHIFVIQVEGKVSRLLLTKKPRMFSNGELFL